MHRKQISNEDDPIVISKQLKENYNHDSTKIHYREPPREPIKAKAHIDDERKVGSGLMKQQSERYRQQATDRVDYARKDHRNYGPAPSFESYDKYDRENLTDRQKYREILETKKYQKRSDDSPVRHGAHRMSEYRREKREVSPEPVRTTQRKSDRYEAHEVPVERSKHKASEEFIERNPYRESESLPYRQSIESMMKSPVMKYKSRTPYERRSPSPTGDLYRRDLRMQSNRNFSSSGRRLDHERDYVKDSSPMSTMKRTSPKDRFQDAKEKFQAMEKIRLQQEAKPVLNLRRPEPTRYDKDYRQPYSPEPRYHTQNEWSSEEELPPRARDFREVQAQRPPHYHQQPRLAAAKSLGNLAKGYRHSYAEPLKYCNRVGLAAIERF